MPVGITVSKESSQSRYLHCLYLINSCLQDLFLPDYKDHFTLNPLYLLGTQQQGKHGLCCVLFNFYYRLKED